MFDQMFYNNILQAAQSVLQSNIARVGDRFATEFMQAHSPTNPNAGQNVQRLYEYVVGYAQRVSNNQSLQLTSDQLFGVVGEYIGAAFTQYANAQQRPGFGFQQSQPTGFGGGQATGNFGGGSVFSSGQQQPGRSMFSGQQRRMEPGSHLGDDSIEKKVFTPASTNTGNTGTGSVVIETPVLKKVYANNPLDDLPDGGMEFSSVRARMAWGGDKPKDNRIRLAERMDLKSSNAQFTINAAVAYHQEILDDPMTVARDFFEVAPDSLLGSVFLYSINYTHLDILDIPTQDFITVREKCIEANQKNTDGLIHKELIKQLKSMHVGPYEALTAYLVKHINRALYLSLRNSTKPELMIKISSFHDLDELLSSSFSHPFTLLPEGRFRMETIVTNAIWNALVKNVSVMFEDDEVIPTHAIQSSPAFPFSIEGVYANKFSVPTTEGQDATGVLRTDEVAGIEPQNLSPITSSRSHHEHLESEGFTQYW